MINKGTMQHGRTSTENKFRYRTELRENNNADERPQRMTQTKKLMSMLGRND